MVVMSSLRVILQASPCKTLWRKFQIPKSTPVRPCSLYTCTYKTRNRACEYTAASKRTGGLYFHNNHVCQGFVHRISPAFQSGFVLTHNMCESEVCHMVISCTCILYDYHSKSWEVLFLTSFNIF